MDPKTILAHIAKDAKILAQVHFANQILSVANELDNDNMLDEADNLTKIAISLFSVPERSVEPPDYPESKEEYIVQEAKDIMYKMIDDGTIPKDLWETAMNPILDKLGYDGSIDSYNELESQSIELTNVKLAEMVSKMRYISDIPDNILEQAQIQALEREKDAGIETAIDRERNF
jgi:hypothetical protein